MNGDFDKDVTFGEFEKQPDPKPNDSTPIYQLMVRDVEQRAEYGKRTYETYLQAHNGRDALRDAYEEALDLALYLKQALVERDYTASGDLQFAAEILARLAEFESYIQNQEEP